MSQAQGEQGRTNSRSLWFGLLSGPVVWSIQFLVVYLLIEIGCQTGLFRTSVLGFELLSLISLVLSVVALLILIYAAYFSYRNFRYSGGQHLFNRENLGFSPARFMAISGMLLNLLFALLIILMAIPMLFLSPCVR